MKARWLFPLLLIGATIASATNMDSLGLSPQRYMMGTPTAPAVALGTPTPGNVRYCINCNTGNPCTAGGSGAVAKADGTAWNCGAAAGSGIPGGSSGNLQTNDGAGSFGAYAGATCPTPGFAISSSASGGWTCATPVPPTPVATATPQSVSGGSVVPYDEGTPVPTPVGGAIDCKGSLIACADDGTTHRTNITITAPTPVPTATPQSSTARQLIFVLGADNGSALVDADDQASIYVNRLGSTITITEVWCESDGGTPTVNLQHDDGSAADILSSNLSCSTSGASTTTFSGSEASIANGDRIDYKTVSAGGTAKRITVGVKYAY